MLQIESEIRESLNFGEIVDKCASVKEAVVLVELNGIIDANFLLQEQSPCKVLGIDKDRPILQIGQYIFSGEYEDTPGTVVVYQPVDSSKVDASETQFEYLCKTDKKLTMKRVFVQEKTTDNLETTEVSSCSPIVNGDFRVISDNAKKIAVVTDENIEGDFSEAMQEDLSADNGISDVYVNLLANQNEIKSNSKLDPSSKSCAENEPSGIQADCSILSNENNTALLETTLNVSLNKTESNKVNLEDISNVQPLKTNDEAKEKKKSGTENESSGIQVDCSILSNENNAALLETTLNVFLNKTESNKVNSEDNGSEQPLKSNDESKEKKMFGKSRQRKHDYVNISDPIQSDVIDIVSHTSSSSSRKQMKVPVDVSGMLDKEEFSSPELSDENPEIHPLNTAILSSEVISESNDQLNEENLRCAKDNRSVINKPNTEPVLTSESSIQEKDEFFEQPVFDNLDNALVDEGNSIDVEVPTSYSIDNEANSNLNSEALNQLVESSTDKMLVSKPRSSMGDDNCSSSGDMVHLGNRVSVLSSDVCQSSDNESNLVLSHQPIEKMDDTDASSSSCHQNRKSSNDQDDKMEEDIVIDGIVHLDSDQTDAAKIIGCEVSQSLKDETQVSQYITDTKDSNECEAYDSSMTPTDKSSNKDFDAAKDDFNPSSISVSSETLQSADGEIMALKNRKLSSCEVTQSNNSEKEIFENSEVVSESEVFLQAPPPGVENLLSANDMMDPFGLTAGISHEVELSSYSLASEGSTSEISQSHKSVIQESESVKENNSDLPDTDGEVCSQSSDLKELPTETKDLCVSSCDITKDLSVDDERVLPDEDIRNASCEVSQSDKLDENSIHSKILGVSETNSQMFSNECDAPSCILEESLISPSVDQYGSGPSHTSHEDFQVANNDAQTSCEVTQSFCSDNKESISGTNLPMDDKIGSNECDIYPEYCPASGILDDTSEDNCVSSDDVSHFSVPLVSENEAAEQDKGPVCEVSQSFKSTKSIVPFEEPSGSSDLRNDYSEIDLEDNEGESKNSCEVTQSRKHDSSLVSELYEEDSNECDKVEMNSGSLKPSHSSDNSVQDICESSDDITAIVPNQEINSQAEEEQPLNYSVCEVSQSYRLEDNVLILQTEQSFDIEIESSNECEVYAPPMTSAPEAADVSHDRSDEKSICESSDDIEQSARNIQQSSSSQLENYSHVACESSKCDESVLSPKARLAEIHDSNSLECEAWEESNNSSGNTLNICESSEDINIEDSVYPERNSDACTSSDKLFKKPANKTDHLLDNKNYDSVSSQTLAGPSTDVPQDEMENNLISQSEDDNTIYQDDQIDCVLSSNSPLNETVKVSSSVDCVSSNYVDAIYSSSTVSNSTIVSNSEVSQSSSSRHPYVWDGNSLSIATSSNLRGPIVTACVSNEVQLPVTVSNEVSVQSSVNVTDNPYAITETSDTLHRDQCMSSSQNEDAFVESSITSSSTNEKQKVKKNTSKNSSFEASSGILDFTSQTLNASKEQKRGSVILGVSSSSRQDSAQNSSFPNQSGIDSTPQQLPSQPHAASQFETRDTNSDPRPSLLEVMVSSASDFRNSLLYDSNSFGKETNHVSSAVESSSNNIGSGNEFSESFISEASGFSSEGYDHRSEAAIVSHGSENSDLINAEVTGSLESGTEYSSVSRHTNSQHQVSQSSDIVNTHSSTSKIQTLTSNRISESFQTDLVQSSSSISKSSFIPAKDVSAHFISSVDENVTLLIPKSSECIEVPESSSVQVSTPMCSSDNELSSENSVQLIESSDDLPPFHETNLSLFKPENTDSEVSSTPFNIHNSNLEALSMIGSEQCSVIEGNVVLLSESGEIFNRLEDGTSANSDLVSIHSEAELIIDASNEADTLNCGSVSSPSIIQMPSSLSTASISGMGASVLMVDRNISASPASEVEVVAEAYDYDGSSEVSESLVIEQNDSSHSALADNNVSCSVVEFSLNNRTSEKKYSFNENEFPNVSREAESKSSDDCISSYESVCDDNMLPVQNLPSSANAELSMYSHIGEFDDSIQSSSLDATHLSINEQIKAISSPTHFSNSDEEQIPLSINPFVSFSSESHHLPPIQCGISSVSKITSHKSFIADETHSDSKSSSDIASRSSVLYSPQGHIVITPEIVSESNQAVSSNLDESSQISDSAVTGSNSSPQEYEVLSEYEEIESAEDENSNLVDSPNDQFDNAGSG